MLYYVTNIVNGIGLALAVWLGIYLITHSPHSPIAWLTGLTLWSLAGLYLNILLAVNPPPIPSNAPSWIFLFFPFWPQEALTTGWTDWLQGWLVIPAIAFWHHVTILLRPGRMNNWRLARVLLGYMACLAGIFVMVKTPLMFSSVSGDPLLLTTLKPGQLYPLFLLILLVFVCMCLVNLIRSARAAPEGILRRQLAILSTATLIAGLVVPISFISFTFQIAFPRVTQSILLACAVALIGYGVARYSALVEGRTNRRDIVYHASLIGGILALYLIITWFSIKVFKIPNIAFIFVLTLVVITHSLVDVARHSLDVFFFRRDLTALRSNLRRLTRLVGERAGVSESLGLLLNSLCDTVHASYGLIFIIENQSVEAAATYRWKHVLGPLTQEDVAAEDILPLRPGHFPPPLTEATLLVPLYTDNVQLGALLLGRPANSLVYSQDDLDLFLSTSDQLAAAVQERKRDKEFHQQVAQLVEHYPPPPPAQPPIVSVEVLEKALRNLHDYAYLGACPLAELKLVTVSMPGDAVTHIERGKAVHSLILQVLNKLRPAANDPVHPPSREWYPYLILHNAYLIGLSNSEIMARLYISEGTFNRTRRAAIRSTALALSEMETAVK